MLASFAANAAARLRGSVAGSALFSAYHTLLRTVSLASEQTSLQASHSVVANVLFG